MSFCPDLQAVLDAFVTGELPPAPREEVETHLNRCETSAANFGAHQRRIKAGRHHRRLRNTLLNHLFPKDIMIYLR